jgi:GNAT superfamily N-acetyltransferase
MSKLIIEVIGSHECTGYRGEIPEVVRRFANETGAEIESQVYRAWDMALDEDVPEHVWKKVTAIRAGRDSNHGFFLNGQWLPLSPHNAEEAVAARQALARAIGSHQGPTDTSWFARELGKMEVNATTASSVYLGDSAVSELGAFCNQFDRVWFFDGTIKNLSVNCAVEQFHFGGYDVLKLIEIANQHPNLFQTAKLGTGEPDGGRAHIDDVSVHLLTEKDLLAGRHPCVITGGKIDPESTLHCAAAARFGGWGYVAMHDSQVCGFLGILPKDVAQRDAPGFFPPGDTPPERTLLLVCLAGGGVFAPQYAGIGVATKLVQQAVEDARERSYQCVEGNPHDPGIGSIFERCGFRRIEWSGGGGSPLRERAFYRLDLTALPGRRS